MKIESLIGKIKKELTKDQLKKFNEIELSKFFTRPRGSMDWRRFMQGDQP